MNAKAYTRAAGFLSALLGLSLTACSGRNPPSDTGSGAGGDGSGGSGSSAGPGTGSGAGGGTSSSSGSGPVSSLMPNPSDVHLTDPDPTTTKCQISGETLVPYRVLTRLNRVEYDNTVRDLLGDTSHLVLNTLPADMGDGGFDNNAAALSIDPALTQQYQTLAESLAENALAANSAGRPLVYTCTAQTDACARQIANDLATRAWRRPVTSTEVDNLTALYTATRKAGFTFDDGIQMVVEGALMSPNFLFRPEIDPQPDSKSQHPVGPYELASRLSYLLWSTMPDTALFTAAANGDLSTRTGLEKQVARMWADPKAEAFLSRFPGQWLATLNITVGKTPDATLFKQFDTDLQAAMQGETANYMREFMTADVDFLGFLDAKFTYVNQRLAQFYGIPGTFGTDFKRVDLTGNTERGGILTQASVLTFTSAPERTSPVMRGQWVLSRLLVTPAPPPPPNVPPIMDAPATSNTTFRQQLEAHVSNPACAGCHNMMDPIGFGLENYDAIGQWRTTDHGSPVDSTGKLITGQTFSGALQLESILKQDTRVSKAVIQYLMSYALGREVGTDDGCATTAMMSAFHDQDKNRMSALVSRVTAMDSVRIRRAAP